jgi:hypothetical protein
VPGGLVFEHGIEDEQEFSHTGGEDDFKGFARSFETLGKGADSGIAAACGKGGHVEDGADIASSAPDGALAAELSGIVVEGSQAREGGDFLAAEASEFGELGQEGGGEDGSDAGGAGEELGFVAPIVVGVDEASDFGIELVDLLAEKAQELLDAASREGGVGEFEARGFCGTEFEELSASGDQLIELGLFFWGFFERGGLDVQGETGEDLGIEAIGFGELAEAAGKVADLPGVDACDVEAGVKELNDDSSLVTAGGLNDDEAGAEGTEPLDDLCDALGVVGTGPGRRGGALRDVELVLRNIDADEGLEGVHASLPILPMRARERRRTPSPWPSSAQAAVRVNQQRQAAILLCDGVWAPRHDRSAARRLGEAFCATLRRPLQGGPHYTRR